jgi:hypothetical protein
MKTASNDAARYTGFAAMTQQPPPPTVREWLSLVLVFLGATGDIASRY